MKALNIITCITSILTTILVLIILVHEPKSNNFNDEKAISGYLKKKKEQATEFFNSKTSEPMDSTLAKRLIGYFQDPQNRENLSFPTSIHVDKKFIDNLQATSADGIRLYFAAYDGITANPRRTKQYPQDEVTIILAPTVNGSTQGSFFDYGDPCKSPCNDRF